MARTILVPEFGVEAQTQISQIEILSFHIPSEVMAQLSAYGGIRAYDCRLEELRIDSVDFNDPALGKRDIEPQTILHNLLTHPARKLRIIVGYHVPFEKADIIPIGRRDAVPL